MRLLRHLRLFALFALSRAHFYICLTFLLSPFILACILLVLYLYPTCIVAYFYLVLFTCSFFALLVPFFIQLVPFLPPKGTTLPFCLYLFYLPCIFFTQLFLKKDTTPVSFCTPPCALLFIFLTLFT